jgi:hypothetical protein
MSVGRFYIQPNFAQVLTKRYCSIMLNNAIAFLE